MKKLNLLIVITFFNSCAFKDNQFNIDVKNKIITNDGHGIKQLLIKSKRGSVLFTSINESPDTFYLTKINPKYNVSIYGDICCNEKDGFKMDIESNTIYTIEHISNGDAASYQIEIIIDANSNLKIISPAPPSAR